MNINIIVHSLKVVHYTCIHRVQTHLKGQTNFDKFDLAKNMYAARAFQEQCILCKAHIRPNSIIFLGLYGKCMGDTCPARERIFFIERA